MTGTNERGATAIIVAASLIFIFGAAALAVDTSSFYQDARTDQTTADMSCLAGVYELPDTSAAITAAAEIAQLNWPAKTFGAPVISGSVGTLSDGSGNTVTINAAHNGNTDEMSVTVSEQADTEFGAVLGATSVTVTQDAICQGTPGSPGSGALPMGIVPGSFNGGLFGPNPCGSNSGNCGGLAVGGNGANTFEDNIVNGVDRVFQKHHGNGGTTDIDTPPWYPTSGNATIDCDTVGSGEACSLIKTKTGQMAGPLGDGLVARFKDDPGATSTFTHKGNTMNADTPALILGSAPSTLYSAFGGTAPGWWEDSLFGSFTAAASANHYYYDGVVAKCDSPRRSIVPIVDDDDNWAIGNPGSAWPNGSSSKVKVLTVVDIIIKDPNEASDFQGNSTSAKSVTADVVWYGPNAVCADGSPVGLLNGEGTTGPQVKLIAG